MRMKKYLAMLLAGAMSVSLLAGCGGSGNGGSGAGSSAGTGSDASSAGSVSTPASSGAAYKIGGIGPLTGGAAIYGTAAMNGAQIAVDEINALGGVQFEFKAEDDVSESEASVNAYNTLMDWGMQMLVGPVTTGPAISVSAKAFEERLFALTPSASSTDVIVNNDNMFQVCFTDPNQGVGAADYISDNMTGAKVAIIYRNDDAYSQGIRDTFDAQATAIGLEVVYQGTFTEGTSTDFSVQLTAAQAAGANTIFLPIYYQPASVILKQASDMGYAPTFFGVDGMDGILTMKGFDAALAEGVMLLTPFSADAQDERTQTFVSEYQARFNEIPNQFAADGYDAVYILYAALEEAGCNPDMSAEEICEALIPVMTSIAVDGLTGAGMTWDAEGAVSKAPMAVVIENGVYVTP